MFVQSERRDQVYLDYAEPQPIFVQASVIELAHIAERSRKCQEKVHVYELIRRSGCAGGGGYSIFLTSS